MLKYLPFWKWKSKLIPDGSLSNQMRFNWEQLGKVIFLLLFYGTVAELENVFGFSAVGRIGIPHKDITRFSRAVPRNMKKLQCNSFFLLGSKLCSF